MNFRNKFTLIFLSLLCLISAGCSPQATALPHVKLTKSVICENFTAANCNLTSCKLLPEDFTYFDSRIFTFDDIANRTLVSTVSSGDLIAKQLRSVENASEVSKIIVIGYVNSIRYADHVSTFMPAYTIYDFEITDVLRGDFGKGDMISIIEYGGYMRGEAYDKTLKGLGWFTENDVIEVLPFYHVPTLDVGSEVVMFLNRSDVLRGTYRSVAAHMGRYLIDENNNVFRYTKNSDIWVYGTLDELIDAVENTPFDSEKYYKFKYYEFK